MSGDGPGGAGQDAAHAADLLREPDPEFVPEFVRVGPGHLVRFARPGYARA